MSKIYGAPFLYIHKGIWFIVLNQFYSVGNDCKLQLIFLIAGKIRGQCNGYARQIYILKCR